MRTRSRLNSAEQRLADAGDSFQEPTEAARARFAMRMLPDAELTALERALGKLESGADRAEMEGDERAALLAYESLQEHYEPVPGIPPDYSDAEWNEESAAVAHVLDDGEFWKLPPGPPECEAR